MSSVIIALWDLAEGVWLGFIVQCGEIEILHQLSRGGFCQKNMQ